MEKVYREVPFNFTEIQSYVITDKKEIIKYLIASKKCYFYDTCSFRNHMRISEPESVFQYIKENAGIVVLTRSIIMELCSNDGNLWYEHIAYIKRLSGYGIPTIVMYEEDVFEVLKCYCSDISLINKWMIIAVKCVKNKAGTIERVLKNNISLKEEVLLNTIGSDASLARRLFKECRANKEAKDNLGEEMIAICMHWLANMPSVKEFSYLILTDDRKAIPTISKAMKNSQKYQGKKLITVVTTPKLCYLMKQSHLLKSKEQIIDILSPKSVEDIVKIQGTDVLELDVYEKRMTVSEFASKIMGDSLIVYL